MAGKKVMLWPSARTRHIKPNQMELIRKLLWVLTIIMVIQYYYLYAFIYAVKLFLMVVFSIWVTKEVEILFYTHDKDISRQEAKELIVKSYPTVTAMIFALMIPVGTPLWLVGLGAALATLIGKLLFGGYHHMVFHSSLVGVILVTLGWRQLVDGVALMTAFDNYVLQLLFDNSLFNDALAIGGLFDPTTMETALVALNNGNGYNLFDVIAGLTPGIIGSGVVLLIMLVYLAVKKAVDVTIPVAMIGSFLLIAIIAALVQNQPMSFALYHLFSGAFLFVAIFVTTDPITTPIPFYGKIIFGVIAGALTMLIRLAPTHEEGVVFAVLFMNMLAPMLNELLKEKRKAPVNKKPAKKAVTASE